MEAKNEHAKSNGHKLLAGPFAIDSVKQKELRELHAKINAAKFNIGEITCQLEALELRKAELLQMKTNCLQSIQTDAEALRTKLLEAGKDVGLDFNDKSVGNWTANIGSPEGEPMVFTKNT